MRHIFAVITASLILLSAACETKMPLFRLGRIASLNGFTSTYGVAVREGVELAVEILGILISSAESRTQVIAPNAFTPSLIPI